MARNIQSNENQRPATNATLSCKALNQDRRPNKELPRQKKSKRIHLHQTSFARDAKGTALTKRKEKREREREEHRYKKSTMNKYLSIITLNVNVLNATTKDIG